jgi:PAB-dependent poly(A)-specific ribonuclease subunit 3
VKLTLANLTIFSYADSLESGLEAEVENGRVARMLIKLGFINERPE